MEWGRGLCVLFCVVLILGFGKGRGGERRTVNKKKNVETPDLLFWFLLRFFPPCIPPKLEPCKRLYYFSVFFLFCFVFFFVFFLKTWLY